MGFGGQKNWGRQEIFLVSGAVSRANNSRCGNLLKTFKNCSNSLRSDSEQFLNNADSHAPRVTTPTANAPETKNISCLLAGCGTAELLLLTSFTVMRLATTGYADEIFSQKILQDDNA